MKLFTRRRFLVALGAGAAGVAAGAGFVRWKFRDHPLPMLIEKIWGRAVGYRYPYAGLAGAITSHFEYLDLDEEGVARFAKQYTERFGAKTWSTSLEDAFERFLLSTDFFQKGADETKPVRFLMLYDPHRTVCFNPLARLD